MTRETLPAGLRSIAVALSLAVTLPLAVAACGDDGELFGPPTESVCAEPQTLTWENFGQKFMTDYCTRCHHSELVGKDRQGAPSFHDFDSVFGVRAVREHVDETTASGPAATNDSMPPDRPAPSLEERRKLGEWLACDAPRAQDLPAP